MGWGWRSKYRTHSHTLAILSSLFLLQMHLSFIGKASPGELRYSSTTFTFLFLLVSGVGCGLWLWHTLDLSINFFYVLKYFSRALCPRFSSFLLALWSPGLGKRELVCVLLVHLFVCFVRVSFCHCSLPPGVGGWLWFVIVALPGLFY